MIFVLTRQNLLALPAGLALFGSLACGDKPSDGTASESSGASDSTSSSSDTDAPMTTGDPPSTTTGETATDDPTTDETSATTVAPTTTTTTGETGDDTTTDGELCEIEPVACGFAAQLGEFEDCGVVSPWDHDTAAWQAAHDCAVAAAAEQRAFCLVTVLQGIDSHVAQAYAAQEARSYALATFFFDSDPCGGGGCGPVLSQASCDTLTAQDNCVIEPGNACLSCGGQSQSSQVCGP